MARMLPKVAALLPALVAVLWAAAYAEEELVLRAGDGRFLWASEDGTLRAGRLLPSEPETFTLLASEKDQLVLKAPNGCRVVVQRQDALRARVGNPPVEQPVESYRLAQIPGAMRATLAAVLCGLVMEKLADKQYDQVTTRKHEKYVDLPAPTLRNPKQKKRHRLLSMEEQYHLHARLDGPPDIRITHMPYLAGYGRTRAGVLMFAVEAGVRVSGRAEYKIPEALDASTGFHTVVGLSVVGELRAEQAGDQLTLRPPKLLELRAELRALDFSNDVLHVVRRQIREIINRELEKSHDRLQQQANEALAKAFEPRQFRSPLLRCLSLL